MSAICGLVHPHHGGGADHHRLAGMLDALDHWGADARGEWSGDGVVLGHLLLRSTPEDVHGEAPVRDADAGLVLTGDIRLDNRDELAGRLGLSPAQLRGLSDGHLVLRAYRRWRGETPERLLGDFAFVVWEEGTRRLFCARDPLGVKPFYYHDGPEAFAFASEIKGLLALDLVPREVDEVWIADFLCRLVLDRHRTFYSAVRRLEPAHTLVVTPEGTRRRRYWSPDSSRRLEPATDDEHVEAFLEAFRRAVGRTVRSAGEVGAELSGGLDSSGIAAVAHDILESRGRTLHTFGQVRPADPGDEPLPPDGRDGIEALRDHAGLAPPVYLTGASQGAASLLDSAIRRRDEPPWLIVGLFNDGLYDAARARGVTVLLSGFGGNQGVTAEAGGVHQDLVRSGRWVELWHEVRAGRTPVGALAVLAGLVASGSPVGGALHRLLERNDVFWQKLDYRPIRDELAGRVRLAERARAYRTLIRGRGTARAVAARRLESPAVALRLEDGHASSTARRMEYRYPLLDRELVELYLGMPPHMKRRRGTGRRLFRESMRGILPEQVRTQRQRASANPGAVLRKRRDRDSLLERLRSVPGDSLLFDYVDRDKLLARPSLRRASDLPWDRDTELLQVLILEGKLRSGGGGLEG